MMLRSKNQVAGNFFKGLVLATAWQLLILLVFCGFHSKAQQSDSSSVSGLYMKAFSLNRQDEVFLDLTPGNDSVAVSKLDNPGITLAIGNNQQRYSIAGFAIAESEGIIPLNLRRAGSSFQLRFLKTGVETNNYAIFLKDDGLGSITLLEQDSTEISFDLLGMETERFSLLIQPAATNSNASPFVKYRPDCLKIRDGIGLFQNPNEPVRIFDLSGKELPHGLYFSDFCEDKSLKLLPSGYYRIFFAASKKYCVIRK